MLDTSDDFYNDTIQKGGSYLKNIKYLKDKYTYKYLTLKNELFLYET